MALKETGGLMDLSIDDVRDIRAIAQELIDTLEHQVALRMISEGNVAIDAAIVCLCYAMKASSRLGDDELLRRVEKYWALMDVAGAPGSPRTRGGDRS